MTLEGTRACRCPQPFMVLATQNPIEQEGTYPLPEAQLDRFLLKVRIDYPSAEDEARLARQVTLGKVGADLDVDDVAMLVKPETVVQLQRAAAMVEVDERIFDYAVAIVRDAQPARDRAQTPIRRSPTIARSIRASKQT